jgi:hypothetical protein
VTWLQENEPRQRLELLRDVSPELRPAGLLPRLVGAQPYLRERLERTTELDAGARLSGRSCPL